MMKSWNIVVTVIIAGMLTGCGSVPTKEKVAEALKPIMPPNFAVSSVEKVSAFKDVYEVVVAIDKQPSVLYVDSTLKYVLSGSVVEIATKKNLTSETQLRNRPTVAPPSVVQQPPAVPQKSR